MKTGRPSKHDSANDGRAPLISALCVALLTALATVSAAPEPDPSPRAARGFPDGYGPAPSLPPPSHPIGFKGARVIGWPEAAAPVAPQGFAVRAFAKGVESPRWLYVLPNKDVLVAQSSFSPDVFGDAAFSRGHAEALRNARMYRASPNRITLLRDTDGDGEADHHSLFLDEIDHPFGMTLLDGDLYIAATNGVWRFPYEAGQTRLEAAGERIATLPAGPPNPHWTRNIVAHPDGRKLYVAVGSATDVDLENIDRKDERRAAIIEIDRDGSGARVFANGLRNPVGMDFPPGTDTLWTVVNERDHLGPDLPPDYLTSVREGGFYGWPFAYFGQNADPAHPGQEAGVAKAVQPDYALGAHTAPLGLAFNRGWDFPEPFRDGAFISLHGSMRRETLSGYRVVFVPFADGHPSGPPLDFMTGFVASESDRTVHGRPAGLAWLPGTGLLIADDAGDGIWLAAPNRTTAGRAAD